MDNILCVDDYLIKLEESELNYTKLKLVYARAEKLYIKESDIYSLKKIYDKYQAIISRHNYISYTINCDLLYDYLGTCLEDLLLSVDSTKIKEIIYFIELEDTNSIELFEYTIQIIHQLDYLIAYQNHHLLYDYLQDNKELFYIEEDEEYSVFLEDYLYDIENKKYFTYFNDVDDEFEIIKKRYEIKNK